MHHTLSVISSEQEARNFPWGSHFMALTSFVCPWNDLIGFCSPNRQTWMHLKNKTFSKKPYIILPAAKTYNTALDGLRGHYGLLTVWKVKLNPIFESSDLNYQMSMWPNWREATSWIQDPWTSLTASGIKISIENILVRAAWGKALVRLPIHVKSGSRMEGELLLMSSSLRIPYDGRAINS